MAHTVTSECVACGACVDTCPVGAISMEDKAVVDASSCVDCGACEAFAPPARSRLNKQLFATLRGLQRPRFFMLWEGFILWKNNA